MNKRQKQLYNTYLRQRKISKNYTYYEIIHFIEIGHSLNDLRPRDAILGQILRYRPELIDLYNKETFDRMSLMTIGYILYHQPQLHTKLPTENIRSSDMKHIFIKHPQMIKHLDWTTKLSYADIADIITAQPTIVDYDNEIVKHLNVSEIMEVLFERPELFHKLPLHKLRPNDVKYLIECMPELEQEFIKLGMV